MTRPGRFFLASSNPEGPSSAERTENPDCLSWYSIRSTISFSSSIIRIGFVSIPPEDLYLNAIRPNLQKF
jgi:hypothetical protein